MRSVRAFLRASGALGAVALLGALAPVGGTPASAEAPWETVTAAEPASVWSDLALHRGAPRIAYRPGGGGIAYAWCDVSCGNASSWQTVTVQAGGDVWTPSVAVDAWGRPRIAYGHGLNLRYAACDAACEQSGSWAVVEFERVTDGLPLAPSLALDSSARPRIAYTWQRPGTSEHRIRYAACDGGCGARANWSIEYLTEPERGKWDPSLALDGDKPRIAYSWQTFTEVELRYAECEAGCTSAGNWEHMTVPDTFKSSEFASLALENGRPRIASRVGVGSKQVAYTTCDGACMTGTSWSAPIVVDAEPHATTRPDLALANGKPRVVYSQNVDGTNRRLYLASCNDNCATTTTGWNVERQAVGEDRAGPPVIATDGDRPRLAFVHSGENRLVYAFCDAPCGSPGTYPPPPSDPPPPTGGGAPGSPGGGSGGSGGSGSGSPGAEGTAPDAGGLTGGETPSLDVSGAPSVSAGGTGRGSGSGKGSSARGPGAGADGPGSSTGLSGLLGDGGALASSSSPGGRAVATFEGDSGGGRGWPLAVGTAATALSAAGLALWRRRPSVG